MVTLVEWNENQNYFVAWDSTGKMAAVYEHEIEVEIPYRIKVQGESI